MAAIISTKVPKKYYFQHVTDIVLVGKYREKTIEYIIKTDIEYAHWLFTRKNIIISSEIEQAYNRWLYLAQ